MAPVSEVITTYVKRGREREYQEWATRIHEAERQFPGYCGGFMQPPAGGQRCWTTLVRFERPEELDAWLESDTRRNLLREHDEIVESWEAHRVPSAFAGWFAGASPDAPAPPVWKQSMLVILVLFPIVVLERRFLNPLLAGLNWPLAIFIGNVVSVALLAWPFMPLVIGRMTWWLAPRNARSARTDVAGAALICALYGLEIMIFLRTFR
jgi:antibiotic biosynthesis monooxygenase (ABM) superfamily enzyme